MDIEALTKTYDISLLSASDEGDVTANEEKNLQATKNSFLLYDEERSDDGSESSSIKDFLDDDTIDQDNDSDSCSTASSMGRLSLKSENTDESQTEVTCRRDVKSLSYVKNFGAQTNHTVTTLTTHNVETSAEYTIEKKARTFFSASTYVQAR